MNVSGVNPFAQGVTGWTGSTLTGSERAKLAEKEAAAALKAKAAPKAKEPAEENAADNKLVADPPQRKYAFDPFDRESWWKPSATKGSKVDAKL